MKPKVSIICITYNQEKYIEQAISSFLSQNTRFTFEVLIHDDCSTDGTKEIVERFKKKYPKVIITYYEKENQYSKGDLKFVNKLFMAARGDYIALCEGDDYWIDALKLQKQVDFLDKNHNYALCFSAAKVMYENNPKKSHISPRELNDREFNLENLLKDNYINTCTVMYRARQDYEALSDTLLPQDIYMHAFHARSGKIGFIKDVTAVYRKQAGGVWWDSGAHMSNIYQKYRYQLTNLFSQLLVMFHENKTYTAIINRHIDHLFNSFIDIDKKAGTTLFADTAKDFPSLISRFSLSQKQLIDELTVENRRLANDVDTLLPAAQELEVIKSSHWYRLNPRLRMK